MAIRKVVSRSIDSTSTDVSFADLTVDTNTLVVDETNNRVGIGTASPAEELEVVGATRLVNTSNASNNSDIYDGGGLVIRSNNNNPTYFYTGGSERVRIDSSGRVTTPYQPSFNVYSSANLNHGNVTRGQMIWDQVRHNTGSHYNTSNGRFTAPIDGRYYFSIEALQNAGATSYYTRCFLYKNGSEYLDGLNTQALQSGYGRLHLNAVVEASAGDYFETWFISNGPSSYVYASYSWFSGHLLG